MNPKSAARIDPARPKPISHVLIVVRNPWLVQIETTSLTTAATKQPIGIATSGG